MMVSSRHDVEAGTAASTSQHRRESAMTTNELSGRPPTVDLDTWQAAREELLIREKAHTREGDAIAAARRRLPMVEVPPDTTVVGPDGQVLFGDVFEGRDELVVYSHMFYDGEPWEWQCEGCTRNAWNTGDEAA